MQIEGVAQQKIFARNQFQQHPFVQLRTVLRRTMKGSIEKQKSIRVQMRRKGGPRNTAARSYKLQPYIKALPFFTNNFNLTLSQFSPYKIA